MSISIAASTAARFVGIPLTVALFGAGVALFGTSASVHAASAQGGVQLQGPPSFTDNGLTLTASAALAIVRRDARVSLGATANLSATAKATTICANPTGHHQPPGQNQSPGPTSAQVSVAGSGVIPASEATFTVTTNPPTTPSA